MRRRISKKQALALFVTAAMLTACSQGKTAQSDAAKESAASTERSSAESADHGARTRNYPHRYAELDCQRLAGASHGTRIYG